MSFLELQYKGKTYTNQKDIVNILKDEKFYWLIDSEVSDAKIKIEKSTLIWIDGLYLSGDWYYGIFKNGEFYGNWINGIFENGLFKGNWNSGINYQKNN